MDEVMEMLEQKEAEWETPVYERLIKVVVVGVASLLISWCVETQYDYQLNKAKERKRNARSRNHV